MTAVLKEMKHLLFLVVFSFTYLSAQTPQSIKEILNSSTDSFNEYDFQEAMRLANKADSLSQSIKYSIGIVQANIFIASNYLELGEYKNALACLNKVKTESSFHTDSYFQSEYYRIRGRVMANLNIDKYALEDYHSQLYHSMKIQFPNKKSLSTFFAYQNLLQYYERLEQKDSVWAYARNMESILPDIEISSQDYCSYSTFVLISHLFVTDSELDSAKIYLTKAESISDEKNIKQKYDVYEIAARIAHKNGNHQEAGLYFEKAFMNAYELGFVEWAKFYAFELADFYKELEDEKSVKFLELGNSLEKSISKNKREANNILIEELINHNQQRERKITKVTAVILICIFAILLIVFAFRIRIFILKNNYKRKVIEENKKLISEKEKHNKELYSEINTLEKDVKENKFLELVELAKNNNPEFLVLFQELYPNVILKLKELNPEIKNSELTFCAYTFLNFTTKQISEYTFVTIAAVQSRKNRYRKKYGIPSEVDFNVWMQDLNED